MKKLNRAIIIISRIIEVFMWVGAALSVVLTGLGAAGKFSAMRFFASVTPQTAVLDKGYGFSLVALDAAGQPMRGAYVIFFLTLVLTFALMAMCARNVHLIFKTSEGLTRFSRGKTPFQPDNIRMVREIGIFLIAIPVVELIMSIVARIALGPDVVESSLNTVNLFTGLVVLALSQYFAYGMRLEQDVDGLV